MLMQAFLQPSSPFFFQLSRRLHTSPYPLFHRLVSHFRQILSQRLTAIVKKENDFKFNHFLLYQKNFRVSQFSNYATEVSKHFMFAYCLSYHSIILSDAIVIFKFITILSPCLMSLNVIVTNVFNVNVISCCLMLVLTYVVQFIVVSYYRMLPLSFIV